MRLLNSIGIVTYLLLLGPLAFVAILDPKFEAWCERSLFAVKP